MKISPWFLSVLMSFYLGIHGGQLALLEPGNPLPVEIFPIAAEMLPAADRQALADGIRIRDKLHLAQLLEDYLS